ncbi:chondroitinase-B domain-containing protein [Lutibacter sp.]|uniref:chondroitinase-B domain-containing protein n=1 Tax=Lutibacter sp. TaxID=1925666 RepID=UPI001A27FD75|nr:chondroitinase-B domain-containing protein [Lutibacter sp.]MBI9040777.1 hypothetical protein [Lutibacter sp.]
MKLKFSCLFLIFIQVQVALFAQTQTLTSVGTIDEFNTAIKKAIPGSTIILKNGIWKDVKLNVHGIGTKEAPITITAEKDGEVIITGNSKLTISGKYMVVNGLWFKDGIPTDKEVISFKKDSKTFAYNCRLTNCTISNYNPTDKSIESHWVDMWGQNNRVDHNNFTGKTNGGTTLVVWLKGEEHIENKHLIDHNFFGERPELGVNGGETIRIGTSENSMKSSKTTVEFNIFKHCNGEIEIISNKSFDNIYRNNLFLESEGTLTLRHGNRALVENNVFVGNNNPRVGGIRIIGEGHTVQNNLLIGISGDDYRAPIVVMNGVPNSPLNRYFQVKNATIQNNTLINCNAVQFGAGKDNEKTLAPINSVFANNLITNTNGGKIYNAHDVINGITFTSNFVDADVEIDANYFTKALVEWEMLGSLPMPSVNNEILKTAIKIATSPVVDITNSTRTNFVAGAFNLGNKIIPEAIKTVAGPTWKPLIEKPTIVQKTQTFEVDPGVETLSKALKKVSSGDVLLLNPGVYLVDKSMKINGNISIIGKIEGSGVEIKANENLEKPISYFFRVTQGASFTMKNITLNGDAKDVVKYAVVSPDENESEIYNLTIDNCQLINFTNKNGGSVFKAYVGTIADTISIKNSIISDAYRGLNLSYEKDPLGKYNAKNLLVHNTVFKNIDEFAINYYKSGSAVEGGNLKVTNCIFSKIYNDEKGYAIKNKNIDNVSIVNSVFEGSYQVKNLVSLSSPTQTITNCLVYDNGSLKIANGAISTNVEFKNPKWEDKKLFIPSDKSPLLKENNGIANIGLQIKIINNHQ